MTVIARPTGVGSGALGWVRRALGALPQGKGVAPADWDRRHRGLLVILWLHVVGVPVFGLLQGYSLGHSLLEGTLLVVAAVAAQARPLNHRLRSGAVSLGLLTSSGLLVHFSGGYIEFHFHFFVMIALLSLYGDWFPFLLAVGYVAVHHGVVGVLDSAAVYNHPEAVAHPWKWAGIHATFVLAAGAANVFTWRMSEDEARRRKNIEYVTEAALARLPLDELLSELLVRISRAVQADSATIWLLEEHSLVLRASQGGQRPAGRVCLPPEEGFHGGIVSRGEPLALACQDGRELSHPVHGATGVQALAGVPLVVEGDRVGVLDVASFTPRRFSPDDVSLLQLVADRVAPTIDRTRLYENEHHIATTLQRSLLPKRLPTVPGIELASRYVPAGDDVAVGGDWYDAVELPNGRLGVAMGDVAGHGSEAAALMGQLRTALRAFASEGHAPEVVVKRLNALLNGIADESMATLLYLELDAAAGLGWIVCAGHPPPLLRAPGGTVAYVETQGAAPLGAWPHTTYTATRITIEPGSLLVLYTDGLVERRGSSLDVGLSHLRDKLAATPLEAADAVCEELLTVAGEDTTLTDDIAVLVVRTLAGTAASLRVEHPADPGAVRSVRRELDRLLRSAGATDQEAYDIVTSSAEACSNAVQHAYGLDGGTFQLAAHVHEREVSVHVIDHGHWRRPMKSEGGRGLLLIRGLMDDLEVRRSREGTHVIMRKRLAEATANGRRPA